MDHFVATVALIGIVIVVASLLSGIVERSGIPLVGTFLLLGAAVGPSGFGLIDVHLDSPALHVLATLGLALVLFSDAVTVNLREVRERRRLVFVVLVPGTLLPTLLIGGAAHWLLGVPLAAAAILGASLASTDPVLLRSVLRAPTLPATARIALRLESGTNDAVLLPIILLAMLPLTSTGDAVGPELGRGLLGLFVFGPALGAFIGWAGITLLVSIRTRYGVRRDYESLYALGLGFAAYAAAQAVGGSGFLAAFAAGLAIAALDVELCDCFLEYGEASAEMLLLFTFVAFGTSLIWTGFSIIDWRSLAFAVVALGARTAVLFPVLGRIGVTGRDRRLIALFGPRGLSTLLLILLPVFAGVAGSERLFTIASLVVLLSLLIHGAIIGYFLRRKPANAESGNAIVSDASTPAAQVAVDDAAAEKITLAELEALERRGDDILLVDARARRSYEADPRSARGAVRIPPEDPVRSATEQRLSQRATLVVYCA